MKMHRRGVLKSGAAAALGAGVALARPAVAQPATVLKFVPHANLTSLDPVWTTASVTNIHANMVWDKLYGLNEKLEGKPQMLAGDEVSSDGLTWKMTLRDGLLFHDGERVLARDAVASLGRWSKRDGFGQRLAAQTDAMTALDDKTIQIRLKKPFPHMRFALALGAAFVMPERSASTDAFKSIAEYIGSGPYRFLRDEWSSGNLIAYGRFDGYVPRGEAPEWTSGAKVAHFERVEWRIIADKATAVAAMVQGEVDWMESLPADLEPVALRGRRVKIENADPLGSSVVARFNHLVPPFDNAALRRFVAQVVRQTDYLATVTGGKPDAWRECQAMFPCTIPGVEEIGRGQFGRLAGKGAEMREALRATGYNGEKVVILSPADNATLAPLGAITAQALREAGMNVDLQDMDWGTLLQRRNNRTPTASGGWSLYHTTWPSIAIANPVLNTTVRGEGATGWPGWFESAEMERLTAAWLDATAEAEQTRLFGEIHALALREMPTLPLGIYFPKTAYRNELTGVLGGSVRYPWNVRRG